MVTVGWLFMACSSSGGSTILIDDLVEGDNSVVLGSVAVGSSGSMRVGVVTATVLYRRYGVVFFLVECKFYFFDFICPFAVAVMFE